MKCWRKISIVWDASISSPIRLSLAQAFSQVTRQLWYLYSYEPPFGPRSILLIRTTGQPSGLIDRRVSVSEGDQVEGIAARGASFSSTQRRTRRHRLRGPPCLTLQRSVVPMAIVEHRDVPFVRAVNTKRHSRHPVRLAGFSKCSQRGTSPRLPPTSLNPSDFASSLRGESTPSLNYAIPGIARSCTESFFLVRWWYRSYRSSPPKSRPS